MQIKVMKLESLATLPEYHSAGAAGMDLHAAETKHIFPGETKLVGTGLAMAIPQGYEAQIRPRSGLSLHGVTVANSPGTIDSDYRGEIKVIMRNSGQDLLVVDIGDRIAQIVFKPIVRVTWDVQEELDGTERGEGGFGSTGKA